MGGGLPRLQVQEEISVFLSTDLSRNVFLNQSQKEQPVCLLLVKRDGLFKIIFNFSDALFNSSIFYLKGYQEEKKIFI